VLTARVCDVLTVHVPVHAMLQLFELIMNMLMRRLLQACLRTAYFLLEYRIHV
jgi:hypothetical protein